VSLPARLNYEADHYASSAQRQPREILSAPIPTFFMDKYTFHSHDDGWIESNIMTYLTNQGLSARAEPSRVATNFAWPSTYTTQDLLPNSCTPTRIQRTRRSCNYTRDPVNSPRPTFCIRANCSRARDAGWVVTQSKTRTTSSSIAGDTTNGEP
jgi:hypothetical protein